MIGGFSGRGRRSLHHALPLLPLILKQVMAEVRAMLGHAVHPDEPLMMAGLDSRGGMELRRTLAESLGMQVGVVSAARERG